MPYQPGTFVLDFERSHGTWLASAEDGRPYLDFAGFHGSQPLGMNPPDLTEDHRFRGRLLRAALHKPSCSDVVTEDFAEFFTEFDRTFADPALDKVMFVEGGALAVENALKVAFDWKAQRSDPARSDDRPPWRVLHLTGSFHGRSGYTLSLTNTRPIYTRHFPAFDWPRVPAPVVRYPVKTYLDEIEKAERTALDAAAQAFDEQGGEIACFIAETIQSEGGDNHLRGEFLSRVQEMCRENDALFVLDEVQSGAGATGEPWAYQAHGLEPDIIAFGKKLQVCGVMAGRRVHEVESNVFATTARIGSTWGVNLTDMVRATKVMEVIRARNLLQHVAEVGNHLLDGLDALSESSDNFVINVRGRGVIAAIDLPDTSTRDRVMARLRDEQRIFALAGGPRSIRFRPPMTVSAAEIDIMCAGLARACEAEVAARA
nr:L-lysine 6-transaminase [Phytoactinopolyspora alkaliphila]